MKPIETPRSRTELVYQAILDDICDGALAPGTHLVQEDLAAKLGVSRQPVQQAMAMLKNDGLVQELGARGLYVAPLDPAMMRHHYGIRAVLDGLAARLSAGRAAASDAIAAEIARRGGAIIEAGNAAVSASAIKRMVRRDAEFHGFLYECSGNPLLAGTAEPHWRYLRRVMGEVMRHSEHPATIWQEHAGILDAIARGDAATAEHRAVDHVERAAEMLARALENNPPAQARRGR